MEEFLWISVNIIGLYKIFNVDRRWESLISLVSQQIPIHKKLSMHQELCYLLGIKSENTDVSLAFMKCAVWWGKKTLSTHEMWMWWEVLNEARVVWLPVSSVHGQDTAGHGVSSKKWLLNWDPKEKTKNHCSAFPTRLLSFQSWGKNQILCLASLSKSTFKSKSVWFQNHGILEAKALVTVGYLYHQWKTGLCYHCLNSCYTAAAHCE